MVEPEGEREDGEEEGVNKEVYVSELEVSLRTSCKMQNLSLRTA
jgi:hypothetical protein